MPREADQSLNESAFVHHLLSKSLRLDSRSPYDLRPVSLRFNDQSGWVECSLGDTKVIAQVSAEIVKPQADRPYEGFLTLNTEISPMASSAYEAGRSSEEEVLMARLLEKALRRSEAVDREALCLVAGQKVWHVRVDVHFLDDCGNLLDCASIAAITALRHFRKPDVTVNGEEIIIHSMTERVPVPLAIHHSPICLTYAFFTLPDSTSVSVLDPTHQEQLLSNSLLTLTLNAQSEICVLSKQGGLPIDADEIMRVLGVGVERVRELDGTIKKALEDDARKRVREVR
ncbi:exosome complex component RRP45 [Sporobolomyces koalae]|uniref:exosome complex component RRP45 n=1 Tax=Sporobolomyces koalae TaxID=500713 RepID=UPI003180C7F9